jgi:hypothetical protein
MRKQNIYDFLEEHFKEKGHADCVSKVDYYRGVAILKYPPRPMDQLLNIENPNRFEFELVNDMFPYRNLIPVYSKDKRGKPVIIDWINGNDAIPGPSCQRFLDSGDITYVPHYTPKSSEVEAMLHGKYHMGSSVNV